MLRHTYPPAFTIAALCSATYGVTVSSIFNFTGTVYFSPAGVTGLPAGASASFSASSITPSTNTTSTPITLTITTAPGITGNYAFTVVGTSIGYSNHLGTSSLSVQDFVLTVSPSTTWVPQDGTVTFTVGATAVNGYHGTVTFSVTWPPGSPPYFSDTWTPTNSVTVPSTTTYSVTDHGSPVGLGWAATLTGTANGGMTHSTTLWLGISPPVSSAPTVSCSATPNPGITGQTVTFAASPSGGSSP
jgi:hypothetical protein